MLVVSYDLLLIKCMCKWVIVFDYGCLVVDVVV